MKTKIYFFITTLVLSLVFFNAMAQKTLLFVGGSDPAGSEDQNIIDSITAWGYLVTYSEDGTFNDTYTEAAAYADFDGVVLSESISSGNGAAFQKAGYPKPCFNYEGFTVKFDKWGWIPENVLSWNSLNPGVSDGQTMVVLDNTHFITKDYAANEEIVWSSLADASGSTQVAYDITTTVPAAIPLAKSKAAELGALHVLCAIPEGTMVAGELTDVPIQRMVIFAVHKNSLALESATAAFFAISKKSLQWVLKENEGGPSAIHNIESAFSGVKLLNNPVRGDARLSFYLNEPGVVSISAVNMVGQQTILRTNESYSAGNNEISFSTSELNAGIYLYQLKTNSSVYTGKMHVLK